jgi:hypothetical protein
MDGESSRGGWHGMVGELVHFTIKSVILTAVLCAGLVISAGAIVTGLDLRNRSKGVGEWLKSHVQRDKTRIRLVGLLTTNPQVHFRVSLIDEEAGNIGKAIDEIELAIGLLELHRAEKSVIDRYQRRLDALKQKAPAKKAG